MSEPRKINISGNHTSAGAADAYADPRMEEARARARANAEAARLRRSQQFPRVTHQQVSAANAQVRRLDLNRTQGSRAAYDIHNDAEFAERQRRKAAQAAQSAARPVQQVNRPAQPAARPVQQVSRPAQSAARPVQQPSRPAQPAAHPAQQAPAAQASAPRQIHRSSNTTGRTIHRAQPATAAVTAASVQPAAPAAEQAVTPHPEVAQASRYGRRSIRMEGSASGSSRSGSGRSGGAGGKPPRGPGRGKNGGGDSASGRGKRGKKKAKGLWWKILLGTVAVIALIIGGAYAIVMNQLRPECSSISISDLINTPKAYADKEFNVLLVGIDRSTEGENQSDAAVNDGMTDMIMWLHFNNETGELKMLQIPRNIFVTTDASYSGNYQINAIAKTQGSAGYNDIGALCDYVADMLKVPIDGYVTIRLEKLVELVDILGGITVYVPQDMSYDGSSLTQGVHNLNGAAAEFFLRNRHSYANSDIGRLNTQRYFYAAIFARLRAMSVWDIAKNLPFYLSMVDTSLDASELVSVAVSLLNVSSDKILLAQVPVYMGGLKYPQNVAHPNDVVVAARQETADLLNTYYRENTGPVDASELNIKDDVLDVSGMTPTDPNVQYMATLNENVVDAVDSGKADIGISDEYSYDLPEPTPTPDAGTTDGTDAADGSSDSTDSSESDNAA